jgi:hypothetical protein
VADSIGVNYTHTTKQSSRNSGRGELNVFHFDALYPSVFTLLSLFKKINIGI